MKERKRISISKIARIEFLQILTFALATITGVKLSSKKNSVDIEIITSNRNKILSSIMINGNETIFQALYL